jgi:hypothetical protein
MLPVMCMMHLTLEGYPATVFNPTKIILPSLGVAHPV